MAQNACGAKPDGFMGPGTAAKLNAMEPKVFDAFFFVNRIVRYDAIVDHDRTQEEWYRGWIKRALDGLRDGKPEAVTDRMERERA